MSPRVPPMYSVPATVDRAVAALRGQSSVSHEGRVNVFAQDVRLILKEREIYRAALLKARETFDRYANLHRDKTPPNQVEAEANHALAVDMAKALELADL